MIQEVLGAHRPTIWVSDLYSAQQHHPAEDWQVCLAHQWRDCQCALEAGDTVRAPRMKAVFLRAYTADITLIAANVLLPAPAGARPTSVRRLNRSAKSASQSRP